MAQRAKFPMNRRRASIAGLVALAAALLMPQLVGVERLANAASTRGRQTGDLLRTHGYFAIESSAVCAQPIDEAMAGHGQ